MSLMKWISGPSAETLERQGDAFLEAGDGGRAKLTFERALNKRKKEERRMPPGSRRQKQLEDKILRARDILAKEHQRQAYDYADGGYWEDALEVMSLAVEICADSHLKQELLQKLQEMETQKRRAADEIEPETDFEMEVDDKLPEPGQESEEEYFLALCSTLPEKIEEAYLNYGEDFKIGYIALNNGDFETAGDYLKKAMTRNAVEKSYIPMELATAYLNLGRAAAAEELLVPFLEQHRGVLPAYRLLCEVYWEKKTFTKADELLASVPPELQESIAVVLLQGETLYQAGSYDRAGDYYRGVLDRFGWNETVAVALAKTYEALDEKAGARSLYKQIMAQCSSCRTKVDPWIRHKYAELCFAEKIHTTEVLENFLSLAQDLPDNAAVYYDRISRIYAALGNTEEARRFRSFAVKSGYGHTNG